MVASPSRAWSQQLAKLPGIGEKNAARLAFHVLRAAAEDARELAAAILDVKEKIQLCSVCCDLTEARSLRACAGPAARRRASSAWSRSPRTSWRSSAPRFRGRYHVLHGVLSPLDGIGPDDLRVAELSRPLGRRRRRRRRREVILATSPNVEGEATALYLAKLLRPLGVRVTRIATGVPIGGELEYADQLRSRAPSRPPRDVADAVDILTADPGRDAHRGAGVRAAPSPRTPAPR